MGKTAISLEDVDIDKLLEEPVNTAFRGLAEVRSKIKGTDWLIPQFIECDSLITLFGDSGTYKSFCAIEIGLSVAHGVLFQGRRTRQGAVFYICGEGQGGIARRIEAWHIHKEIDVDAPFYLTTVAAQLSDRESADAISSAVQEIAELNNVEPILIIVDTLSANLGQGDESSNSDIARFLNNLNTYLRAPHGASVLVVHHVGHGDKSRERGAYAIRGNTDCRIKVERVPGENVITLTCHKMKDAPEWEPFSLRSKVITLPKITDSEGNPATSLVLEESNYVSVDVGKRAPKQQAVLDLLQTLYDEHNQRIIEGKLTSRTRVSYSELRSEAEKRGVIKDRSNFSKQIAALKKKGEIYEESGFLFIGGRVVEKLW